MQKGISTVIAALLMLIITIALAGFAYTYISGILTQKTQTALTILGADCIGDSLVVDVRNDGTTATTVLVTATHSDGTAGGTCTTPSIGTAASGSCTINRPVSPSGSYRLRAVGGGAVATGSTFCSTAGVP